MPSYEMALIMRVMERPQLVSALKRTAEFIVQRGGILRSFENIGERQLPYRMSKLGKRYTHGTYFMVNFDSPSEVLPPLKEQMAEDLDILRPRILRREVEVGRPCDVKHCEFGELSPELRQESIRDERNFIKKV